MTRTTNEVAGRFPGDVRDHALTVLRDDGVYRHLRFAKPGTYCGSFDVLTWPGRLCFCGDMGTFVFARVEDMLTFFRRNAPSYDYWAEKVEAQDRDGVRAYDQETFLAKARELIDEAVAELDEATRAAVRDEFEEQVLNRSENDIDAHQALAEFNEHGVSFSDSWEYSFEDFTYRYAWCCNALVWAVKTYDAHRAQLSSAAVPA